MASKHNLPTIDQVNQYLELGRRENDGPWIDHVLKVGEAARLIAKQHPELDEDKAYICGVLHDIGRIEGRFHLHHAMFGYNFMMEAGYPEIARICMTHSFPLQDIKAYSGKRDCSHEEIEFITKYLEEVEYDDYDRLIQLCDALALPDRMCVIEQRLMDVTIRYGFNDYTIEKWKKVLGLVDYFSQAIGTHIYKIIPVELSN